MPATRTTLTGAGLVAALALGTALVAHHLTTSAPATTACGVEFWAKKTGTDPGAQRVDLTRQTWASVHSLQTFAPPSPLATTRAAPVETTVYRVSVTLVQFKTEADSDVHLVIAGSAGRRMIAEIPAPACVGAASPFSPGIAAARQALQARYRPSTSWQTVNVPITLTGVGFFDFDHGQIGAAPNAVELHPILSLRFTQPQGR